MPPAWCGLLNLASKFSGPCCGPPRRRCNRRSKGYSASGALHRALVGAGSTGQWMVLRSPGRVRPCWVDWCIRRMSPSSARRPAMENRRSSCRFGPTGGPRDRRGRASATKRLARRPRLDREPDPGCGRSRAAAGWSGVFGDADVDDLANRLRVGRVVNGV